MNAFSPEMVGCYRFIVNNKKKTFISQSSRSWSLAFRITGFSFGFFFTNKDDMKTLLMAWFLQVNPILIILLATSVSLALLTMPFIHKSRRTTFVVYKSRYNIVV